MSKLSEQRPAWTLCDYCDKKKFSTIQGFMKHLLEKHCSRNGDLLVCRYGESDVCSYMSDESFNSAEYERHVLKYHTMTIPHSSSRKSSVTSNNSDRYSHEPEWVQYTPAQNLPAVLNDPNKGKQKDLFTKTWGDSFVELTDIPDPHYLPHISIQHFEHYLKKIGKKHKQHLKLNLVHPKPHSHADLLQTFPNLRIVKNVEKSHFDISIIPKIFLQQNFDLSSSETFNAVFSQAIPTGNISQNLIEQKASNSAKLLQEKFSHYLDMVEVQIAHQVAQKSDAFFHAMTSHDVLMEQLGQTISLVKTFREKIKRIDNDLVHGSLKILRNERLRTNYHQVLRKLKVMSTVMQTQPTIQLLLSSPDYVGALDLIHTTEDLLKQELAGIHSFRHLSSELAEMLGVIDTLMKEEFEKYATADLNRPLVDSEPPLLEAEKLICIVMGMLRRGNSTFVDIYETECVAAVKAAIKQAVIEVIAGTDRPSTESSIEGQLRLLTVDEWATLLANATSVLLKLLQRIKKGYNIMVRAVHISAGNHSAQKDDDVILNYTSDSGDWQLSHEEEEKILQKLKQFLIFVSRYSQERCAQLLSSRSLVWPDEKMKEDSRHLNGTYWLAERATLTQLKKMSFHVKNITESWDKICPDAVLTSLKSAFNVQAIKFMNKFHSEKMKKLFLLLDSEPWRQTDVPATFQELVNHIADNGTFAIDISSHIANNDKNKTQSFLMIGDEKFAVVGTVLLLVNIIAEYCMHAEEIPSCGEHLYRYLSELLTQFNSRCYSLVLGGDAVSEKTGLKTITINNLALQLRSLQLILWLIPHVRVHFQGIIGESSKDYLDKVSQKFKDHAGDVNAKLLEVMHKNISAELRHWDAKPPVPSKSFQNICKHLKKCHEAVYGVLPHGQIQELYKGVNTSFINTFSEKLQKMNILNNGGPTHGLVTQELLFYLEDFKQVKALPPESLELSVINEEIWMHTIGR